MSADFDGALVALIGAAAAQVGDRVFINRVPQREELPAIVIRRLGGGPPRLLSMVGSARRASWQVEGWSAASQDEARRLIVALEAPVARGGINGLSQRAVGPWWLQALLLNEDTDQDNPQVPTHADDLGLFCSFCEFTAFYREK